MAVNQKSFWDALRPVTEVSLRGAVQGKLKYRNYLKSALMGALVERPSGTYIGHYDTGALHKSIKDFYTIKSLSAKRYKIKVESGMLGYGYELSDGYRAEMVPYGRLSQWAGRKGITDDDLIGRIWEALRWRPFRKGSGWIKDADEDFFPAFEKKVALEATKEIEIPVEAYIDNALRSIFRGKNEKVFNRGAQL